MSLNVFFVMYRESFEAILIVGILYSYLTLRHKDRRGLKYMWAGVLGGLGLSALLAVAINLAQTEFQGQALDYFNDLVMAGAVILMTHMCVWMKQHARTIKSELQNDVERSLSSAHYWGIAAVACLSVGREGSEAVIFLYGMAIESIQKNELRTFSLMVLLGLAASYLTWLAFARGFHWFKQQYFFRLTTAILFLTASSLVLTLSRKLIQDGQIPSLQSPLWDLSGILDEQGGFGRILASVTGYESRPALMTVLIYVLYWAVTLLFYYRPRFLKK